MGEYLSPDVYLEERASEVRTIEGVGTTAAGFVGTAEKGPIGTPTLITSFSQYVRVFGAYLTTSYLSYAVADFFKQIKGRCWVVRTAHYTDITDPATLTAVKAATAAIQDRAGTPLDTAKFHAASEGVWANSPATGTGVEVKIVDSNDDPTNLFAVEIYFDDVLQETYDNLNMDDTSTSYFAAVLAEGKSSYVYAEDLGSVTVAPDNRPATGTYALTGGDDGLSGLATTDYVGNTAGKTGLYALDAVDEVNQIAIPGQYTQDAHNGIITYCTGREDCHGILDSPLGMTPTEIKTYVQSTASFNSKWAFIYYPWIVINDPLTRVRKLVPPSGQVCGIIAKTDVNRGVWKAPAGVEDGLLLDVLDLEVGVDKATRDVLYPARINSLIKKTGKGFLVWGNRTLSAASDWRSINVRRNMTYIEESIVEGTDWAVYEPNDQATRDALANSIRIFLLSHWNEGGLYDGGTGRWQDAFYVKCDADNNPQSVVDQLKIICEVGAAPKKAAEFIIIRITQWDGGRLIEELTGGAS